MASPSTSPLSSAPGSPELARAPSPFGAPSPAPRPSPPRPTKITLKLPSIKAVETEAEGSGSGAGGKKRAETKRKEPAGDEEHESTGRKAKAKAVPKEDAEDAPRRRSKGKAAEPAKGKKKAEPATEDSQLEPPADEEPPTKRHRSSSPTKKRTAAKGKRRIVQSDNEFEDESLDAGDVDMEPADEPKPEGEPKPKPKPDPESKPKSKAKKPAQKPPADKSIPASQELRWDKPKKTSLDSPEVAEDEPPAKEKKDPARLPKVVKRPAGTAHGSTSVNVSPSTSAAPTPTAKRPPVAAKPRSSLLASTLSMLSGSKAEKAPVKKEEPRRRPGEWGDEFTLTPEQEKQYAASLVERKHAASERARAAEHPLNLQEANDAYRADAAYHAEHRTILCPGGTGIATTGLPSRMVAAVLAGNVRK